MKAKKLQKNRGFSLIELLVAISLFAFVSVAAVSAMLAVVDGNKKARAMVDAMDNLSFALESMTRELRVGSNYSCNGSGDCGAGSPGTRIEFLTSEGSLMAYRLDNARIQRCGSSGIDCPNPLVNGNYVDMTGNNITIDTFEVYVLGSAPATAADEEQPRAILVLSGTAGTQAKTDATFSIQTTVTQRFPDF